MNSISKSGQSIKEKESYCAELGEGYLDQNTVDLYVMVQELWKRKVIIALITLCFAVVSVWFALDMPNVYRAEVTLSPASESGASNPLGIGSQLGGLASLAGVSLGTPAVDKTDLALKVLESRAFIGAFVRKREILVPLMASQAWESETNTLVLNPALYDVNTKSWVRDVEFPYTIEPSSFEAFLAFMDDLTINKDGGFISVSYEHISPHIAHQWLSWLIEDLNLEIKRRDLQEAHRSMSYLEEQLQKTSVSDIRTALFNLLEEQLKTIMFAEIREEYAFKTIDPAIVPQFKAGPSRALFCILLTVVGFVFSVIVVFFMTLIQRKG